jgi:hypothetical protein
MAKGALKRDTTSKLYWRKYDEKTGKWTYKKVVNTNPEIKKVLQQIGWEYVGEE